MSKIISEAVEDIKFKLGESLVDVELEESDYIRSLEQARKLYLQRAENATSEVIVLFIGAKDKQQYDLTDLNIQRVHAIYRHSIGVSYSADQQLDPFTLMYHNNFMAAASNNSGFGSIGIMHMQQMHVKLLQTMMANEVQFIWDNSTKQITLLKAMRREERLLLHCEVKRSMEDLLEDSDINPWVISYATSLCKQALGIAYSKFQTLAGPNGGVSLGGETMRQEGKEEQLALEEQLVRLTTSTKGMPFTTG